MEITTTSLLANQLQTLDPKATLKEQTTQIVQKSADLPLALTAQSSGSPTPNNAQDVITQLLGSAISEAKSKSTIYEILQNNQLFKNMGNFSEDIQMLNNVIKPDSTIAKPLALLQLFSKNIEQLDVKMLQNQIQNSGIFFESKLANIVTNKGAEQAIQTLNELVKSHLTQTNITTQPLVQEVTSLLDKLSTLQELSSKDSQTTLKTLLDQFRQVVKQELTSEPSPVMKEVYQTAQKLDYAIKQMDLIASKVENYPASMNVDQHFTTQVKVLLEMLKESLSSLQLDDLQPQIDQLLSKESLVKGGLTPPPQTKIEPSVQPTLMPEISKITKPNAEPLLNEPTHDISFEEHQEMLVKNEPLQLKSEAVALNTTTLLATATQKAPESVEEALKMVVNRIKQQIELLDPKTVSKADFVAKSSEIEQKIHSLIKPELFVGKSMAQKLSLDPTDVELLSDIKGVLTKLNDALASSSQNKEAYEITNRLLTQVEYHQLFSYVSSSTHLYIPFSWDGLKGGSMMMKQTNDETFHCQLDLDLEQYGKLNMMLMLSHEKYIDISVAAQKNELKDKITQQLPLLKRALNEVGLITGNLKMLEYKDVSTVKNDYFSGDKLQFGINIKI